MSLKEEALRGVAWSATQKWGVRLISFTVMLVLARLVLPESFGLVAYATVFTAFAEIFVDVGFSDAIVQFRKLDREHLDTAFWISILTGTFLSLATIAASGLIANGFHEPRLVPVLRWLSPVFILYALSSVQQSLLRRNLAFKSLTMRSLIATISSGVVAVIMAFLGFGVWSLVAKLLVDSVVTVIVLWKVSSWRPTFHVSRKHIKELFSFGINILGGNFVDFLSVRSGDFLIGYFLGPIPLGYYSLGYNLLTVMIDLLVSVPNLVIFPIFSKIQGEPERLKSAFYEVIQLQSIIAFPIFLGIFIVAPEAIRVLYSDIWIASIPIAQLLMLTGIVRSAILIYSSIFRAAGKPSWRFYIYTLTAILNVAGFLLVVRMGIIAVAASYVVVSYLLMPLYLLMIRKLINVSIRSHLSQYVPSLVSSLIMIVVVLVLKYLVGQNFSVLIRLIIYMVIGAGAYLLSLRLIRPGMYTKMLELAKLAFPKFMARNIDS